MEIGGSNPGRGLTFLASPKRLDRLWVTPNVLFNWYRGLFSWEQSGRGVKLNTSVHEVPRLRILALYLHYCVCPGVNLPFHKS